MFCYMEAGMNSLKDYRIQSDWSLARWKMTLLNKNSIHTLYLLIHFSEHLILLAYSLVEDFNNLLVHVQDTNPNEVAASVPIIKLKLPITFQENNPDFSFLSGVFIHCPLSQSALLFAKFHRRPKSVPLLDTCKLTYQFTFQYYST